MPPVPDPAEAMTHGVEVARPGTEEADPTDGPDRAERAERWFTGPVVVAAIASVPAMFLTALEGAPPASAPS